MPDEINHQLGLAQTTSLPVALFALTIIVYLCIVAVLRYRNLNQLRKRYAAYIDKPHSMGYTTAKDIIATTMTRDFPFMFAFSLQWALIKSYGISTGTALLVRTRRLTDERMVGKRSEDTGLFLYEMLVTGIDTPRGRTALAKMNWIHARYGSAISNGDLIHTLGLFVLEPIRYINNFEWRKLDRLEEVALFVYWKEIGNRMGMVDIPDTLDDLVEWMRVYEKGHVVYSPDNTACYDGTVGLYLRPLPESLRPMAKQMADSLAEPYVRKALGVEDPPAWAPRLVHTLFGIRALLIRYCSLPRFKNREVVTPSPSTGRLQRELYLFEPWYVKETKWSKLLKWWKSDDEAMVPGPKFLSEGYFSEELGPKEFRTAKAAEEVGKQAELLDEYAKQGGSVVVGCPFAWAR